MCVCIVYYIVKEGGKVGEREREFCTILILMRTVKCVTLTGPKLDYKVSGPGESTW